MPQVDLDLFQLQRDLISEKSFQHRFAMIQNFYEEGKIVKNIHFFSSLSEKEKYVVFALFVIGQGKRIFQKISYEKSCKKLIKYLLTLEEFYEEIGGIVGYHVTCLRLLAEKGRKEKKGKYHSPIPQDLSKMSDLLRTKILAGISHLPKLAEIYPIGGAADRLSLRDETTGELQIAATLEFDGKPLLERLIEDLQGREYLYWKLFGKQICVPIVLMSSSEKKGTQHVQKMLREKKWFGRSKEDFFLFSQPLVPTMDLNGTWCMKGPDELLLKPGGHGVIWKLAKGLGALEWLERRGKTKALVRQINNLIAGTDYGLLAFTGIGFHEDKDFGFAACPSIKGMNEGVDIVIETKEGFSLTNIEYCDFERFQIQQEHLLANTNILFVDLQVIEDLIKTCPIPGMLVNAKKMKCVDQEGYIQEKELLRLESTMQNIADALIEKKMLQKTFITSHVRRKTISTIKKESIPGASMLQTPERCYLDFIENAADLLQNYCQFTVPSLQALDHPSFIFFYHSALGPAYEIIGQKLRNGSLAEGSELRLQVADLDASFLEIEGSLLIATDAIMGYSDDAGKIHFSDQSGKCTLENVQVKNLGIDKESSGSFWKNEIVHREKCEIVIEKGGEFFAKDVTLEGNLSLYVPSGMKVTASMENGKLKLRREMIEHPSWKWEYSISKKNIIELTKKLCR